MFKLLLLLLVEGHGSQSFFCSGAEYAQSQITFLVQSIDVAYGDSHS
jgi:hypothetical protein